MHQGRPSLSLPGSASRPASQNLPYAGSGAAFARRSGRASRALRRIFSANGPRFKMKMVSLKSSTLHAGGRAMNTTRVLFSEENTTIAERFDPSESIVVYPGSCLELLKTIPNESLRLIVTSPPYNIGKEYETKLDLDLYLQQQARVIAECVRTLAPTGAFAGRWATMWIEAPSLPWTPFCIPSFPVWACGCGTASFGILSMDCIANDVFPAAEPY